MNVVDKISSFMKKISATHDTNNNHKLIDETIYELNQCREDERNYQGQQIQTLLVAGTITGLIFGANFFDTQLNHPSLLYLNIIVLTAAFSYILALGIVSVLRFHYIRDLEDRLSTLLGDNNTYESLIHWMSFSSPITTRNIKNVKSIYTLIHYLNYALVANLAIIFCGIMTVYNYTSLGEEKTLLHSAAIRIFVTILIFGLSSFIFFSMNAKKMFLWCKSIAAENKRDRINKSQDDKCKEITRSQGYLRALLYFIYPKSKDLQKLLLIIFGSLAGLFLMNQHITSNLINELLRNMVTVILVFDVLIYQARYQLNDLRGLEEDLNAGDKKRLPVDVLGIKNAVLISSLVITVRLIIALIILVSEYLYFIICHYTLRLRYKCCINCRTTICNF